jgi:hypothetical protein
MPFADVSGVLERVAAIYVPGTTVWREVQAQGQRLLAYEQQQEEKMGIERTHWQHQRYDPQARVGISMDGGMVAVRGEGWKEFKVGSIGRIERKWTEQEQTVRLTDLHYVGVVGDVDRFKQALWKLAVQGDTIYAGHTVVTADGAAWIWRLASDLFPCSVQIVDWYHAVQHLAAATADCHPLDPQMAAHWLRELKNCLFQGHIEPIIDAFQSVAGGKHQPYFRTHKRRMAYQEFWENGYPIGSGTVESGIKQFKQRLTGPGMRWSRSSLEPMILLRAAVLSHSFHSLWSSTLNSPPN